MSKKLPSIPRIKKALYADWALRVKKRDGFKCLLCGATENLTAHHWYVCDHHAHAARYCVDNGATLCYACHIRGVHQRADWETVNRLYGRLEYGGRPAPDTKRIDALKNTELTTELLRAMWNARRSDPWMIGYDIVKKGKRLFFDAVLPQMAAVGNTVNCCGEIFEVLDVKKTNHGYRYTVKPLEDDK